MSCGKYIAAPVVCLVVNDITKSHCTQLDSIYFCSLNFIRPRDKLNENDWDYWTWTANGRRYFMLDWEKCWGFSVKCIDPSAKINCLLKNKLKRNKALHLSSAAFHLMPCLTFFILKLFLNWFFLRRDMRVHESVPISLHLTLVIG